MEGFSADEYEASNVVGGWRARSASAQSRRLGFGPMGAALAGGGPTAVIYAAAGPPPRHDRMRLAPNPGAPKLRAPGSAYRKTGFSRPVLSGVRSARTLPLRILKSSVPMPENFCWQPQDLTSTMQQGDCGSCWAHAAASVLGDRVAVQTRGATRTALSVQQLMECSEYPKAPQEVAPVGCEGNEVYMCLKSMKDKGVALSAYNEYVRNYTGQPSDPNMCGSSGGRPAPADKYSVTVDSAFLINEPVQAPGDAANLRNIENMKHHIYFEGPIIGTFLCYSDFQDYDGMTIYEPSAAVVQADKNPGGHAIELLGWGKDPASGTGYWVGRNSWGADWPHSGHRKCTGTGTFYFRMGSNTCEIETWCAGATPTPRLAEKAPKDAGGMYPGESACAANAWDRGPGAGRSGYDGLMPSDLAITIAVVLVLVGVGVYVYRRRAAAED
jgi:hypothetical protein